MLPLVILVIHAMANNKLKLGLNVQVVNGDALLALLVMVVMTTVLRLVYHSFIMQVFLLYVVLVFHAMPLVLLVIAVMDVILVMVAITQQQLAVHIIIPVYAVDVHLAVMVALVNVMDVMDVRNVQAVKIAQDVKQHVLNIVKVDVIMDA